jgi:hypothetical protein
VQLRRLVTDADGPAEAVRARAVTELEELTLLRQGMAASGDGLSPSEISEYLTLSDEVVARMLKRGRLAPERLERTPREVALLYAAGQMPRQAMIDELAGWSYTYGYVPMIGNYPSDAYVRGTWDQVSSASLNGLISMDDYEAILEATPDEDETVEP